MAFLLLPYFLFQREFLRIGILFEIRLIVYPSIFFLINTIPVPNMIKEDITSTIIDV